MSGKASNKGDITSLDLCIILKLPSNWVQIGNLILINSHKKVYIHVFAKVCELPTLSSGQSVAEWLGNRTPVREVPESIWVTQLMGRTSSGKHSCSELRRSRTIGSPVATTLGFTRSRICQTQLVWQ